MYTQDETWNSEVKTGALLKDWEIENVNVIQRKLKTNGMHFAAGNLLIYIWKLINNHEMNIRKFLDIAVVQVAKSLTKGNEEMFYILVKAVLGFFFDPGRILIALLLIGMQ